MASYKTHFQDCQQALGNGWAVVHHWLDEMARIYRNESGGVWMGHRVHHHHKEGIEEVRKRWGDEAARAAEIHILKDEGNIPTKAEIEKKYKVNTGPGD